MYVHMYSVLCMRVCIYSCYDCICVSILVCVLYNIVIFVVIVCVYLLGTTLCRLLAFCVTHFEIDNNYTTKY